MAQNKPNKNKQVKQQQSTNKKSVQDKISAQQKSKQATVQKKKCGTCKWLLGSAVLIALIVAGLIYDTETNGKGVFANSATGAFLKNAGVLPHVERAWYTTMGASARAYKWAEKTVPPYAAPICELTCNLYKLIRNAFINIFELFCGFTKAKWPTVSNFIEQYVPGLPLKIENTVTAVKNVCVELFEKTVVFLKTQVFVGRLSPENLNTALNNTRNIAIDYYNIFHKKVDVYAKLK